MQTQSTSTLDQLSALGYRHGERVYLRGFLPASNPDKLNDKGTKAMATIPHLPIAKLKQWQSEGRGVYFVVNGGGHDDAAIADCRAIFYEHDRVDEAGVKRLQDWFPDVQFTRSDVVNKRTGKTLPRWEVPKNVQSQIWLPLGLPEPTYQVDTGGKSVHSYWVFDEPIPVAQWRELQSDLLEFADADRSLKNPSRVMRLAGFKHAETGETTTAIGGTGKRHSYESLRAIIPHPTKAATPKLQRQTPTLPLDTNLEDRRIESALMAIPPRTQGSGTYEESVQVLMALTAHYGPSEALRLARRWSPDSDWGENLERKINGFKREGVGIGTLFEIAKGHGWQCPPELRSGNRAKDDDLTRSHSAIKRDKPATNGHHPDPPPDLLALIRLALTEGLTDTQLELRRAELSHLSGYSDKSFNSVWARVESDLAREEDRDSNRHKVTSLLGKDRPPFDLVRFLGEIGKPLAWIANAQNMRHESYLFAILAATGGIAQNGTKLCIHRGMNFYVTPNSFFAIVSPPSQRKSPLIDTAVTDAFRVIQSRLTAHYQSDLAQWEDEGSKGKPPQERLIYFSKPSGESLPMQAQRFPQQGLTWIRDELSGIFAGANQYRNGLGSDLQDLLEYHDGRGPVVLRVDGVRARQDFHLSIIGGVQPEIIRELIGNDAADHDGKWSRFMFVSQPVAPATLPDADGGWVDTTEMLAGIYERVMLTPAAIYSLSREAFRFYQEVYNNLEKQRASESHAATAAAIGKLEGRIGKLALSLHLFHAAATGQPPAKEIPLETVISATELAEISLEELKALYADAAQELPAKLKRILDLAQRKGERGLSVREACQSFSGKNKPKAPEVRTMFLELEAMGLATFKDGVLLRKD